MSSGQNPKERKLTEGQIGALTALDGKVLELSTRLFKRGTTYARLGRIVRRCALLERRGLVREIPALQSGYKAYVLTPQGEAQLDRRKLT